MKSVVRLFTALPIKEKGSKTASKKLLQETLSRGFMFSPQVVYNYSEKELLDLVKIIEQEIGLTPEQMNNTFQKSWKKVRDAPMIQLFIEQIIHYITTYGFERLGIYDENSVYVPAGDLDIPELKEDFKFVVINGYTKDELKEKLLSLLNTGIALAEDTKKDVIDVAVFVDITNDDVSVIQNREVRIVLYEYFGLVPEDPVEFLRFLVFKATGRTLLIKNKDTFETIKTAADSNPFIVKAIRDYQKKYGLANLATIFYRFKPLFLALRANSNLKPIINKVRRLANVYHEPMESDYLNEVTAMLKHGVEIDAKLLRDKLSKANTFRKIRLAQALKYRNGENVTSILYKIRNGKAYATDFSVDNKADIDRVLNLVLESIVEDVRKNVEGKKVFIPEYIEYAMPATEKQFTGNLPSGTCVTVDKNMVFGVHWENQGHSRIDLDLSLISANDVKIGWDGRYRSAGKTALFSGDLTSAPLPQGASELFYLDEADESHYILFLNYYNFIASIPVPFKILVAQEEAVDFTRRGRSRDGGGYMVDPNNVLCISKTKIEVKQKMLGLVVTTPGEIKFYFSESEIGRGITSGRNDYTRHARKYLFDYSSSTVSLSEVLVSAGAILVDDEEEADIDLSPEKLEKATIIDLLQ